MVAERLSILTLSSRRAFGLEFKPPRIEPTIAIIMNRPTKIEPNLNVLEERRLPRLLLLREVFLVFEIESK